MLSDTLQSQLKTYLERLIHPVELIASLDDRPASADMRSLLQTVAAQSPLLRLRLDGQAARRPSFQVTRAGQDMGIHFAALPLGHEFASLVLALLHAGGHPPKVDAATIEQIQALPGPLEFETFLSLSCHNCPDVVQALNLMAVLNPRIRHVAIDGGLFPDEVRARQVMAVPSVMVGGQAFASGRMALEEILARLDASAAERDAERLSAQEAFDVLVVGGGPAGAAAAVYAARKGVRTGILAERFGGQTLDTLAIENFISVRATEGPKFAADLEAQARAWGVALMKGQRVTALEPAAAPGELATVHLASGATLRSRAVVLAPGARWRTVDVPGEADYRNRGVAYCPHCDGPLFKGQPVAVIGGGNSGIEAAIDLAGIAAHVTVLEYADALKADAVLVRKLRSLSNVTVHTGAKTTEIAGDGQRVTGLRWTERFTGTTRHAPVAGVFVQIGLVANTEWLRGTLALSPRGEIEIDDRGATSAPGIFAAGDATTVPYKQIIVASGEGAKAALSAFDHLIRTPAQAPATAVDLRLAA